MVIPIDKKYRLATNTHGWMIQAYRKPDKEDGDPRWGAIRWYMSVDKAAQGLADLMVYTSSVEGLDNAIQHVHEVCETLTKALSPKVTVSNK